MENYIEFLKSKIDIAPETGLDVQVPLIKFKDGTELKPHQRDAINCALQGHAIGAKGERVRTKP